MLAVTDVPLCMTWLEFEPEEKKINWRRPVLMRRIYCFEILEIGFGIFNNGDDDDKFKFIQPRPDDDLILFAWINL